jgi:hypothetical protein
VASWVGYQRRQVDNAFPYRYLDPTTGEVADPAAAPPIGCDACSAWAHAVARPDGREAVTPLV